jgi:type IV pilus assembly protein PilA
VQTKHSHPESGFTLLQLLLTLAAILVLMTAIVPTLEHATLHADENEAIASLKTLNQMEGEYAATYPDRGFTCSFTALGGRRGQKTPTADAAQLITPDLASGSKAGYRFSFTRCTTAERNGRPVVTGYALSAVPERLGRTGSNGFCTSDDAHLAADPTGGVNCTELLRGEPSGSAMQLQQSEVHKAG